MNATLFLFVFPGNLFFFWLRLCPFFKEIRCGAVMRHFYGSTVSILFKLQRAAEFFMPRVEQRVVECATETKPIGQDGLGKVEVFKPPS